MAFYKLYQTIYYIKDMKYYMTMHFNWLFRAICLVDAKYLKFKIDNPDDGDKHMFHKERVFAYELYRQWANILETECKESIVLNAELNKIISEEIEIEDDSIVNQKDKTVQKSKKKEIRRYPDLVLHHGQGDDKDQIIVCEIKRNDENKIPGSLIFADLYKLACFMDKKIFSNKPFEYGVFILLNGDFEQIKNIKNSQIIVSLKKYNYSQFKKDMGIFFDRIVCVIYNGKDLEYRSLKSLL